MTDLNVAGVRVALPFYYSNIQPNLLWTEAKKKSEYDRARSVVGALNDVTHIFRVGQGCKFS
jgi:hypothetical protein